MLTFLLLPQKKLRRRETSEALINNASAIAPFPFPQSDLSLPTFAADMKGVRIKKKLCFTPLSEFSAKVKTCQTPPQSHFFSFFLLLRSCTPPRNLFACHTRYFPAFLCEKRTTEKTAFLIACCGNCALLCLSHVRLLCTKVLDFSVVAVVNLFVSLSPFPGLITGLRNRTIK